MVDMSDPANYRKLLDEAEQPPEVEQTSQPTPVGALAEDSGDLTLDRINVEVRPNPDRKGDVGPADVIERFSARVDEVGAGLAAVAGRLRASLADHLRNDNSEDRWQMSTVVAEFGINLEAQTGIVIAQGKAGSTFKVTITWKAPAVS